MRKSTRQRKSILINTNFQLKYTLIVVGIVLFLFAFFSFDAYYSLKILSQQFPDISQGRNQAINQYFVVFFAKMFAFMIGLGFLGIWFTHRIAGPIYRISKDIIAMANDSDLSKVFTLREYDEFKELTWSLNELVNSIRTRLISDDNFREKVQFAVKHLLSELEKKSMTDEEKSKITALLNRLYKESSTSPVQFKL